MQVSLLLPILDWAQDNWLFLTIVVVVIVGAIIFILSRGEEETAEDRRFRLEALANAKAELQAGLPAWGLPSGIPIGFMSITDNMMWDYIVASGGSRESKKFIKGLQKDFPEHRQWLAEMPPASRPKSDALQYRGDRHMVTIAPTGSGKNTTMQTPALMDYEGSALVIDPKGQLAAITGKHRCEKHGQRVVCINPFEVLGLPTVAYNPLRYLNPKILSFASDCRRVAEGLVDQKKGDHWEISALEAVTVLIMWTCCYEDNKSLVTVRQLLNLPDDLRAAHFQKIAMCSRPEIGEGANRYTTLDSKEVRDCLQTAVVQLGFLRDPAIERVLDGAGSGLPEISFSDLKRNRQTVYLIIPPHLLHTHGRFLRLMVMSALGEFIHEETKPEKEVLFMLDEFAALGYMPLIESAASFIREYRVKLWIITQNIPDLKKLYGNHWEGFISAAGLVQFFTPNDLETATYVSQRSGVKIEIRRGKSTSFSAGGESASISETEYQVPRMSVQDVLGFEASGQVLLCPNIDQAIKASRRPYWEHKRPDWLLSPDPYHSTEKLDLSTWPNCAQG